LHAIEQYACYWLLPTRHSALFDCVNSTGKSGREDLVAFAPGRLKTTTATKRGGGASDSRVEGGEV
jgi:hypothetical protein